MNMLTAKEITLIKKSWISIQKIDPLIIADVFYTRLFYENPELRKLFSQDMEEQYKKLVDMLNTIITRLEKLDDLKGDIVQMAKRHVNYGVMPEHYNMVGKALLWTLQKTLGADWNAELRAAWVNCYAVLSGTMITVTAK